MQSKAIKLLQRISTKLIYSKVRRIWLRFATDITKIEGKVSELNRILSKLDFVVLITRLYDYMCVMSTIPTLNPQLNMTNKDTKSKTTLGSGSVGFAPITIKSNRSRVSPFRADKAMLNSELSRISKD